MENRKTVKINVHLAIFLHGFRLYDYIYSIILRSQYKNKNITCTFHIPLFFVTRHKHNGIWHLSWFEINNMTFIFTKHFEHLRFIMWVGKNNIACFEYVCLCLIWSSCRFTWLFITTLRLLCSALAIRHLITHHYFILWVIAEW